MTDTALYTTGGTLREDASSYERLLYAHIEPAHPSGAKASSWGCFLPRRRHPRFDPQPGGARSGC